MPVRLCFSAVSFESCSTGDDPSLRYVSADYDEIETSSLPSRTFSDLGLASHGGAS